MSDTSKSSNSMYIHAGWFAYQSLPGSIDSPSDNCFDGLACLETDVPGSLFNSLSVGNIPAGDAEDYDWWYKCNFSVVDYKDFSNHQLVLERLATLAEVWLNGAKLITSENMFLTTNIDVAKTITAHNTLIICFRSVNQFLKQRRPRPRWKTKLVNNQQLRWLRTSLLGRIPGWTPAEPALGPCGKIQLTQWNEYLLQNTDIHTRLEPDHGVVSASIKLSASVKSVHLKVGDSITELSPRYQQQDTPPVIFEGEISIDNPVLWWPCTHGEQYLYPCQLTITTEQGEDIVNLGYRAFREIEIDTANHQFQLRINNNNIFTRGACWTIADLNTFFSDAEDLRSLLILARDANINMLRIGGTMTYEQDDFYSICDELGIMVWQDFMFANMDYPVDDPTFLEGITAEVCTQLKRLSQYACITIFCGNSEVQQQAAMVGIERERWGNSFFDNTLPQLCAKYAPHALYVPSTPYGGALPFHQSEGICHFYGVGAYKKSLLASGIRDVKFTTESLGFSHVPEPDKVDAIFNKNSPACHSPLWKQGIPRDSGAGWDFEDIRDHYIQEMFHVDPVLLRSKDTLRYLAVSRVVTGELIKLVISHWRSPDASCAGALIWFYKDIVPGAGWGLLDEQGDPKSIYYYIQRAFQPLAAFLVDRGLNGLDALILNETCIEQHLRIDIKLLSSVNTAIEQHSCQIKIEADSHWMTNVEAMLGYFRDVNYNYQFGTMQHQLVSLQVFDTGTGELLSEDFYFPGSLQLNNEETANIIADLVYRDGQQILALQSDRFLQAVYLDIPKLKITSNYFHMMPDIVKNIPIDTGDDTVDTIKGYLSALNLSTPIRLSIKQGS